MNYEQHLLSEADKYMSEPEFDEDGLIQVGIDEDGLPIYDSI